MSDAAYRYPANRVIVNSALGVVVHSKHSLELGARWLSAEEVDGWVVIPLLRRDASKLQKFMARDKLGIPQDAVVVASFGVMGATKLNDRLIDAWLGSGLSTNSASRLIFVGECSDSHWRDLVQRKIDTSDKAENIQITGWVSAEDYQLFLSAADVGVQLRTMSRGETSAAVLDCMSFGLPTIVNANGSMAELEPSAVHMLQDKFSDTDLSNALDLLAASQDLRQTISEAATHEVQTKHAPSVCAEQYYSAIEAAYLRAQQGNSAVVESIARLSFDDASIDEIAEVAKTILQNCPDIPQRKIFLDITGFLSRGFESDMDLQLREAMSELLQMHYQDFRFEPVYLKADGSGFWYARALALRLTDCPTDRLQDEPIDFSCGDIYVGMAVDWRLLSSNTHILSKFRSIGAKVCFAEFNNTIAEEVAGDIVDTSVLLRKLLYLAESSAVLVESKEAAHDLMSYLSFVSLSRLRPLQLNWPAGRIYSSDSPLPASRVPTPYGARSLAYMDAMLPVIYGESSSAVWMPDDVIRFFGGDSRFGTVVGIRRGTAIHTTKSAGYLIYGPYVYLARGAYVVELFGAAMIRSPDAMADVCIGAGMQILAAGSLQSAGSDGRILRLRFHLDVASNEVEIRVLVSPLDDVELKAVQFSRSDESNSAADEGGSKLVSGIGDSCHQVAEPDSRLQSHFVTRESFNKHTAVAVEARKKKSKKKGRR